MEYRRIRIACIGSCDVIKFAQKELKAYLQKADPDFVVDEMTVTEAPAIKDKVLVLKVSEDLAKELQVADAKWDDGYRIQVTNDSGVIEGTNCRSVLLGTYRFLKELGFAFTRPGKEGDRIPAQLPTEYAINLTDKPARRHRGVTIEGSDTYQNIADMIDFIPKCGMNTYFVQFWVPGTFFDRWYLHKTNPYLEEESITRADIEGFLVNLEDEIKRRGINYHKTGHGWTCEPFGIEGTTWDTDRVYNLTEENRSYLALVNGKRELWGNIPLNTNLCYSNPVVRGKMTDAIRDYSISHPQIDVIHLWLADGSNNHCECENCQKKIPADWFVTILNELDEKMTAAGLTTKIVFLIYVDLLWEPKEFTIKNPDRFILMFAPITRYYGQNYSDSKPFEGELSPYVRNRLKMPEDLSENMARLDKWREQFHGDSFIFDYHLQWSYMADPGCELAAKNMYEDMCYLKEMDLNGNVSCQVQRCFFPSALEFRALAAGLWNADRSFEEVEAEFYKEVYGDKGPEVQAYLSKLSSLFTTYTYYKRAKGAQGKEVRPEGVPYVVDYALVLDTVDAFVPVIQAAIAAGGQAKKDWQNLLLHVDYVKRMAKMLKMADDGNTEGMEAATEEFIDFVNRNELFLQNVLDGDNLVRLARGHMQGTF